MKDPAMICRSPVRAVSYALALLLAGCATNALRLEYATDVAARGKVAAAAARQFLVRVDETRIASNLDLIAIDPACVPNSAFVRIQPRMDRLRDPARPPRGWLCAAQKASGVTYDSPFSLAPFGDDMEPTFVLIDALGAYAAAVADILDEKGSDPVKDLTDALGLARSADGLLHALAGGNPIVPAADDPRVKAVSDFIVFVSELQTERDKVAQLRKLAGSTGSTAIITALKDHLANWEQRRRADEGLRFVLAGVLVRQAQAAEPPLAAAARRDFARAYYDRAAGVVTSAKLKPVLDATLDEVGTADADLRRTLADHPKLSADERAKLAAITRERIGRAFDTLAQLVIAFKGV